MISKAELDLEVRLSAIETVLVQIGKIALLNARITPEQAAQMRENGREAALKETIPGLDAALADHFGAELAERVGQLLDRIHVEIAAAYRSSPLREP